MIDIYLIYFISITQRNKYALRRIFNPLIKYFLPAMETAKPSKLRHDGRDKGQHKVIRKGANESSKNQSRIGVKTHYITCVVSVK